MCKILKELKKHWDLNKFLMFPILTRRLLNKLYNFLFLSKYNIKADYTSYIFGLKYMTIGNVSIGRQCRIEMIIEYNSKKLTPELIIGKDVILNDRVHIGCANHVEIGDNCLFASNIYISDHNHGKYKGNDQSSIFQNVVDRDLDYDKSVIIGHNVWLGEGVAILPGSKIGNNCVIGSNAVVTGLIPPNSIAVGVPARVIKILNK